MARSRNIKPGLFKNEVLGIADPIYTLLFEGLWLLADRDGRLEDRPMRIKAETFPYREGLDTNALLDWLADAGFILRYKVAGASFIQILSFGKHQNPHKNEAASDIPAPELANASVDEIGNGSGVVGSCTEKIGTASDGIGATSEEIGSTRADSLLLIPDSLSSDSLSSESDDSGVAAAQASPMSAKDKVWTLGVALLGDGGRRLLGKLVATHTEEIVADALSDCARERPIDPKSWIVKACEVRAAQKPASTTAADLLANATPAWAIAAGFGNRFDAENAGCFEHNHKSFKDGRRAAA